MNYFLTATSIDSSHRVLLSTVMPAAPGGHFDRTGCSSVVADGRSTEWDSGINYRSKPVSGNPPRPARIIPYDFAIGDPLRQWRGRHVARIDRICRRDGLLGLLAPERSKSDASAFLPSADRFPRTALLACRPGANWGSGQFDRKTGSSGQGHQVRGWCCVSKFARRCQDQRSGRIRTNILRQALPKAPAGSVKIPASTSEAHRRRIRAPMSPAFCGRMSRC